LFTYTAHTDQVNEVAWSPDGTLIASASADKTVRVWQVTQGAR
jgi:WD40 repeat protein